MRVLRESSGVNFIYPFLFDPSEFSSRVNNVSNANVDLGGQKKQIWDIDNILEAELLPHVSRFILSNTENNLVSIAFWKLNEEFLQSTNWGLGGGDTDRVTWTLKYPNGASNFRILDIRLALFRSGAGFIIGKINPTSENPAEWIDLLHYFRFYTGQRGVELSGRQRVGIDGSTRQPLLEEFFPDFGKYDLPDGEKKKTWNSILTPLLCTASYPEERNWWKDIFIPGQLFPYSYLFLSTSNEESVEEYIYRYRKMFHSKQEISPQPGDFDLSISDYCLQYVDDQWFIFSLNGAAFVAINPKETEFFKQLLPNHLDNQYFYLLLFALQQRFSLIGLNSEIIEAFLLFERDDPEGKNEKEILSRLNLLMLNHSTLGNFMQTAQRDNLHTVYSKWLQLNEIADLDRNINARLRNLLGYLQARQDEKIERNQRTGQEQSERLQRSIDVLGWLLAVIAIGLTIRETLAAASMDEVLNTILASLVLALVIWGIIVSRKKTNGKKED